MRGGTWKLALKLAAAVWLAPLPIMASNADQATIWFEGEAVDRTNLPAASENPYRAKEFWEADVLSGGNWIGMEWEDAEAEQPFLEFDFDVPENGTYFLYARKFGGFGNFRWRVDDGAWQSVPLSLHKALETVAFREDDEQIYLGWYAMGGVELAAGSHTLRVEPLFPDVIHREVKTEPLAYDAFLLTKEPFFPSGKNPPWIADAVQTAHAFAPDFPIDDFGPCAIDWRRLNETTTGENGGITVRDGQFVFRDSGEAVRLLGVNIGLEALADAQARKYSIRRLAKLGFNLVRIDVHTLFAFQRVEGRLQLGVDEEMRAVLADVAASLAEEGMVLALTWNVNIMRGTYDVLGIQAPPAGVSQDILLPSLMLWRMFDPEVENLVRAGWKTVLNTPLAGGGTLGRSPVLAFVTLAQQDTVFSNLFPSDEVWKGAARENAETRFAAWLAQRPGGLEDLSARWGDEAPAVDSGRTALLSTMEMVRRRDPRAADTARFLAESQREYFQNLIQYFRKDLGYEGIVSTSNKSIGEPDVLGWANDWSVQDRDVLERLGNQLAFFEGSRTPWNIHPGSRYLDRSAIARDPLPGRESSVWFDSPLRHLSRPGMPSFSSEISWPLPNRFRSEMPLLATTMAAWQGIDALALHFVPFPNWQSSDSINRNAIFTPGILGQMPAFAFAFRQGLLPQGPVVARVGISEESAFSLEPSGLPENADSQMNVSLLDSRVLADEELLPPQVWAAGRVEVTVGAEKEAVEVTAQIPDGEIIAAGDGAITWQPGLFAVRAPAVQAAGGFLARAGRIDLGTIAVTSPMEFGVVCAVALDGQPLAFSHRILLQVYSEESNTGAYSEGEGVRVVRSTGRPPMLTRNLRGNIELLRPDASDFVITALDANGYPSVVAAVGETFSLLPTTLYYLIEK